MTTQTLLPICFSTTSLDEALQELSFLPIENLSIVEDGDGKEHLIFGEIASFEDIPPLQFCQRKEIETDLWTEQWAQFAPHFKDGFAHINLQEYEGPGLFFRMLPGAGFGDLSHPTTEMCLRALCGLQSKEKVVVDIGTGSGVLALAAHQLGFSSVIAVEIDEASLAHAEGNFLLNGASSIALQKEVQILPKESLILLNMTLGEQEILWENSPHLLEVSSEWIISGLLIDQVATYLKKYFPGRHSRFYYKDEWACLHILP